MKNLLLLKKISFTTAKPFNKAKMYVNQYGDLLSQIEQQTKQISILSQQVKKLEELDKKTLSDKILNSLFSVAGKTYEGNKVKQQNVKLKQLRIQLQDHIKQSDVKWQQPRKKILQIRTKICRQFLVDLLELQSQLAETHTNSKHNEQIVIAMQLNHRFLQKIMNKENMEPINAQPGIKFDSKLMEAVSGKGKIVKNLQRKGWKINEEILLKAQVHTED